MNNYFIFFAVFFIASSCTQLTRVKNSEFCHNYIFNNWYQNHLPRLESNQMLYFAPSLEKRYQIFKEDTTFWESDQKYYGDIVKKKQKAISIPLHIPDSLNASIKYLEANTDILADTVNTYFFSPLLPSKQHGIYFIEVFSIFNVFDSGFHFKFTERYYELFSVRKNNVTFLKEVRREGAYTAPKHKK